MKRPSRRSFLKQGSAATAALGLLGSIQSAFAQELAQATAVPGSTVDFDGLAQQYLLDPDVTYLNHASIGTISRPVQRARQQYLELCEMNPWLYVWGGAWDEQREAVRGQIAGLIGSDSSEVAITHNSTEFFNVLAHGLPLKKKDEVLFSSLCHAGASLPFVNHQEQHGRYRVRRFDFPMGALPQITADIIVSAYRKQIRAQTRLLVIPHMDNTVGVRYPVAAIARMAREEGVEWIAVDAAQTVGMVPVDMSNWDVDFLATSPHKWLGAPKGLGVAVVRKSLQSQVVPMWTTWGQDRWGESARKFEDYGTRNIAELLTLGDAVRFYLAIAPTQREARLRDLWSFARAEVARNDRLQWGSPDTWELAGSLYSIRVEKPAAEVAKELFDQHGVVVRPFSTLGLNNLRVSPNAFTRKSQIEMCLRLAST